MIAQLQVNYLSVLVATIAAFFVGGLWHGPVFGKQWMKLMEFTPESIKKMKLTPAQAMTMGFLSTLLVSFIVAVLFKITGMTGAVGGLKFGALLWLGFEAPIVFGSFLWEGRSLKLFCFNATYRLVELLIIAVIISGWG